MCKMSDWNSLLLGISSRQFRVDSTYLIQYNVNNKSRWFFFGGIAYWLGFEISGLTGVGRKVRVAHDVKFEDVNLRTSKGSGANVSWCDFPHTVPFRLIRPSRVTGPVVLAEFSHLSRVTTPMADDSRWIQKMVKKGFSKDIHGVGQMEHFFLLTYLRINEKIYLRFNC